MRLYKIARYLVLGTGYWILSIGCRLFQKHEFKHPLGGLDDEQVAQRAADTFDSLAEALARAPAPPAPPQAAEARRVTAPADAAALQEWYFERHWSDGCPVVPPTAEAVARMVALGWAQFPRNCFPRNCFLA